MSHRRAHACAMTYASRPSVFWVAGRNPDDARQRSNTWWRNYRSHAAEDAKRIGGQVYRRTPGGLRLDQAA